MYLSEHTKGNPYRRFHSLSPGQCRYMLLSHLEALQRTAFWSRVDGCCWLSLTRLSWDSERLGVEVGKADIFCDSCMTGEARSTLARILRTAIEQAGLNYLRARIIQEDTAALAVLTYAGFRVTGRLLNLALLDLSSTSRHANQRVVIRHATIDDEPFIRDVASRCYENQLLAESRLNPARIRSLYGDWAVNNLRGRVPLTLIASIDDQPAGFLSGGASSIHLPSGLAVGFIDLIVVHQRVRQQGIGRALMLAAIAEMHEQGAALIELNVADTNVPAIKLYTQLGFEEQLRYIDLALWVEP